MPKRDDIITKNDRVLVTGAGGFVGSRVVAGLVARGFADIRALMRPSNDGSRLATVVPEGASGAVEKHFGNLLSPEDCRKMTAGVKVVYHLAAGTGLKAHADAFLHSVVTTRNLLNACLEHGCVQRFVNVSSFAVYTNRNLPRRGVLDESAPVEKHPALRYEAYCYAKVKQDELVEKYGRERQLPFVHIRPGVVFGSGKHAIPGRVGIDSFGVYLHFGGGSRLPLTYVDNCADAIVLAGLKPGIDGETFNIVDDDLPTSRRFLRLYMRHVRRFRSIAVPKPLSWLFCLCWEKYCQQSHNQIPPAYTRREWAASWRDANYPNDKAKLLLGWQPQVPMAEGLQRYFASCRKALADA